MKNVKLNWSPVDPKYQVTNYHVFVGKSPDTLALFQRHQRAAYVPLS